MRKALLFVSAVAMVATGLWLLHAESFSADIIFGAAALTTLGSYLLWIGAAAWNQSGKVSFKMAQAKAEVAGDNRPMLARLGYWRELEIAAAQSAAGGRV